MDSDYISDLIVGEYGEMEPLYKSTVAFRARVRMFWKENTPVYNALIATTEYDYNPLDDHDYKTHRDADGKTHNDENGENHFFHNAFNQAVSSPHDNDTGENHRDGKWEDHYDITRNGINRNTYQELIEQQRRVVEFHVEHYILRDWRKYLMVAVW